MLELNLSDNKLGKNSSELIHKYISNENQLHYLNISNNHLGDINI